MTGYAGTAERVRDITIGRQRLRVATRDGRGTPLLLCNGIGATLELLDPFVEALDPDIPVIRFDVPGIGGSPMPTRPYSILTLGLLLRRLLDHLGHDEADVLGISWGGAPAQQLALQCGGRVRRLVLVSTATGALMVPARPTVLAHMLTPHRYRDLDYAASVAPEIYGGSLRTDPGAVRDLLRSYTGPASWPGYFLQLAASAGWTSLPVLPLIRQPTLLLAGDDDPIVPLVNARIMHGLLPDSTLHVFRGGHLGLLSDADVLAPVVADFLRR